MCCEVGGVRFGERDWEGRARQRSLQYFQERRMWPGLLGSGLGWADVESPMLRDDVGCVGHFMGVW